VGLECCTNAEEDRTSSIGFEYLYLCERGDRDRSEGGCFENASDCILESVHA
jgi:hypothetical protein